MKTETYDVNDIKNYVAEKMIAGDAGDGIPNIFSAMDTFVTEGKRQVPVKKTKLKDWAQMSPETFCAENGVSTIRYTLNQDLMDLTRIPEHLTKEIIEQYETQEVAPRRKLMSYFIKNRMKLLMDCLGDF